MLKPSNDFFAFLPINYKDSIYLWMKYPPRKDQDLEKEDLAAGFHEVIICLLNGILNLFFEN
jgi:hypothetical protein